ncbi:DotU/TssL family secretion system protein (plasmid) [Pantoea dispersa]|uniref:DotU/TssL family secretion system protein n=1 Tax=Pantoea dispersa TaxID=59814 RepID=UPI001CA6A649|nr:DotU/TssL family secretion system protein [Pantoea dispersa]QZY93075.1 DotU/TssL family secretion system protein [Pantoea dispersa]
MNDFERRIREALNLQDADNPVQTPRQILSGTQQITRAATGALAAVSSLKGPLSVNTSNSGMSGFAKQTASPLTATPPEDITVHASVNHIGTSEPANARLQRPGMTQSVWDNSLIAAAFPLLMQVADIRHNPERYDAVCRAQWGREAQHFQQTLIKQGIPFETVNHLTYLMFAWIDETLSRLNLPIAITLLVEFYQDAWGGEKCFEHLNGYWQDPVAHRDVLQFYDLVLSLGFFGKFAMIERGPLLLADLRHQLDLLLYLKAPTTTLSQVSSKPVKRKKQYVTPLKLMRAGGLSLLLVWGISSWLLHDEARDLRTAIVAWTPPEPKRINIMTTLPQPLPSILKEGWLEVRKDPRGWLLIFTSDGAFATGKATLLPEFIRKRNIERLGEALSDWPGDLEVIGHTDSEPFKKDPNASNLRLSQARADVVATRLRSVMSKDSKYDRQIQITGKGDSDPLADNDTEAGRKRNRRVDILWKIGERAAGLNLDTVQTAHAAGTR